jgi:GT2 family glycosyltransferase
MQASPANGVAPPRATAALVAPAAVWMVDLDSPLPDLRLTPGRFGEPYRSLLAIARLDGELVGSIALPVDLTGRVPRERLARGFRGQLEPELRRAFSDRGLPLPGSLPSTGVPGRRSGEAHTAAPRRSVSVVIATCCRPATLERCVRSVRDCDDFNAEIIVVENRPDSAATRQMLASKFAYEPHLRYIEEPVRGASRARNAGLALAEGEIVAFLDDDVVVDPAWLSRCVQAFEAADDVACVTGLILPLTLESHSQLLLEQFATFGKGFRREVYRLPDSSSRDPLFPYTVGSLGSGANTVLLTEAARQLGGFDSTLGPGTPAVGAEDLDLFQRVLRAGHAVVYDPSAIVRHSHPRGMKRLRRQAYRYGVGMGALLGKQLLRGPERGHLLRAVPAGLRYARDPSSRKNAGKPAGFPRRLDWLERLGMLIGPLAYLVSAVWIAIRRRLRPSTYEAKASGNSCTAWLVLRGRTPIQVRFFTNPASATPATPATDATVSRTQRPLVLTAATACVAAPPLVALGAPGILRLPAVLALVCLAPGTALMATFRRRAEAGLVLGFSLGATAVLAQSMLWLGAWWPTAGLFALALACLPPLVSQLDIDGEAVRRSFAQLAPEAGHAALLTAALLAWSAALMGADVSRIGGIGLLDALPVTYFLAFALLLAGFVAAATRTHPSPWLLGVYVLGLIVLLHGTTPLLYDEPRYAWTYKHLGVIELIASTGGVDREIDIYNNWPAFFAANAWFSSVVDLKPMAYAPWAQVFFNVANVAAVRFALRGLTDDERVLWTAGGLFVLGNWVGQDYLAPQAFGFLLSLVILGLCLRWRTRPALDPYTACAAGAICFLAVVTSHQLSPALLIASVVALWLVARQVPVWIPGAMVLIQAWWIALAWPFVDRHFSLIDPGSGGAAADARDLGAALPGAAFGFYAPAGVILTMAVLAAVGGIRMLRTRDRVLVPACLVVAPILTAGLQSYGGEGIYRAYLFALPWLAFFAARACVRRRDLGTRPRLSPRRLSLAAGVLSAFLLFAYFGQELVNHISPGEVRAAEWYERNAPTGSTRLQLAPSAPARVSARYPKVTLADPLPLLDRPAFRGRLLGDADLPRIERLLDTLGRRQTYVVLSRDQENFARLNGLLPAGSMAGLRRALAASPDFRSVYRRLGVWVFKPSQ